MTPTSKQPPPEKCPECGTEVYYAPGIGPYCPNPACVRIDDLGEAGVTRTSKQPPSDKLLDICEHGMIPPSACKECQIPSKTLVKRLRSARADMLGTDDEPLYWAIHEAAAEIERLTREREWDDLPIDDTCDEFDACTCYEENE